MKIISGRQLAQTLSVTITPATLYYSSITVLPSADTLRPAPAVAVLLNASGSEDSHRVPYLVIPAGVVDFEAHLRMSGGQACDKQADQYIGKQPGEASVATSRDTAAAEDEVHASDHTHRKSMPLKDQPALLAPNSFAAALEAVPADDWCRTWAAGMTITLRRTSKRVKEVVDKMHLPAVVRLSRSFWDDTLKGTLFKSNISFSGSSQR